MKLAIERNVCGRLGLPILLAGVLAICLTGWESSQAAATPGVTPPTGTAGDGNLDTIVEHIRATNDLPALSALMVHDGMVVEKSAMGNRAYGTSPAVTVADLWHLGSLTKSMTSTLAATLVKQGQMRWDMTLAEVYPDLVGRMRTEYETVRLDELLSHTSGLTGDMSDVPGWNDYFFDTSPLTAQRQTFVEKVLTLPPKAQRGTHLYSNAGYIVAGAMMETVTGSDWESLIQTNLFQPLGMINTGFGPPDTQGALAQPVGHAFEDGQWIPVDPAFEPIADNPAVLGPAGTVHSTLVDIAPYIAAHLAGARGHNVAGLLSANEFNKLHTPFPNTNYALGWGVYNGALIHSGSNTFWLAHIIIVPAANLALFIVTNAADLGVDGENPESRADKASEELIDELIKRAEAAFGAEN